MSKSNQVKYIKNIHNLLECRLKPQLDKVKENLLDSHLKSIEERKGSLSRIKTMEESINVVAKFDKKYNDLVSTYVKKECVYSEDFKVIESGFSNGEFKVVCFDGESYFHTRAIFVIGHIQCSHIRFITTKKLSY